MSRLFSGKLILNTDTPVDASSWDIYANVIDNTGNYFSTDAQIGDVIYLDGSMFGLSVLRYVITNINTEQTFGTDLYATVKWDMGSTDPVEPFGGLSGIIGAITNRLHMSVAPSITINLLDESFMTAVRNYENANIVDNLALNDSPALNGRPESPTPDSGSNDHQIANTEWVNNKLDNIDGLRQYVTLENIDAYKIVYIDKDEKVGLANSSDSKQADCVIGITLESKLVGETISVMLNGEIKNDAWNLTETGKKVFVGESGNIELDPSKATAFLQQIGIVGDDNVIILNIQESIIL